MLVLWLVFIVVDTLVNYNLIKVKKQRPIYIQSFIIRGIVTIVHGALVGATPQNFHWILLFQTTSFWLLFDSLLNKLRGKPLLYKGANSGWLDRLPKPIYLLGKALAIIGLIFAIYKLYKI